MIRTKAVKFPKDILDNLMRDLPGYSNPARIRLMYNDYLEMKALKDKLRKAGEFIYGRKAWNGRYKK